MAQAGSSSTPVWFIAGIAIIVVIMFPKLLWIVLAGLVILALVVLAGMNQEKTAKSGSAVRGGTDSRVVGSGTKGTSTSPPQSLRASQTDEAAKELQTQLASLVRNHLRVTITTSRHGSDELVTVGRTDTAPVYGIPRSPKLEPDAKWIKPGETVSVQDVRIPGGMIYIGTCLPAAYGENDPCLIDPSLSIAKPQSFAGDMGYWPTYARVGAASRRKYLDWLAGGRNDQYIDIGYVFLFFYGLERRVLIDAPKHGDARAELDVIAAEIDRLLAIYGSTSHSFQRYAFGLLDVIQSADVGDKLYSKPIPDLPPTYELPQYVKVALGQASRDEAPLPADLAMAWAQRDPGIYFRTAAERCATEFGQLFRVRYHEKYGAGMIMPKNRTKLKCVYQPASSGFRGQAELILPSGDLPDVTAVTGPIDALADLVKRTTEELDPYSRMLGKSPETKDTPSARLLLPMVLWPDSIIRRVDDLCNRAASALVELRVSELLKHLDLAIEVERKSVLQIARHLGSKGIAMEPDIEAGARTPKPADHIVLFAKAASAGSDPEHVHYRTAQLALQLAAMVAMADGEFSEPERKFIHEQIAAWEGLTEADRVRLNAHLRLVVIEPVTLGSLKKKIEGLTKDARTAIAGYMATLVSMDGIISPDEVRVLEKTYKALGLETASVFSDLHATNPAKPASSRTPGTTGFQLDHERVRALQSESQEVSRLLAGIFTEEATLLKDDEPQAMDEEIPPVGILGLDHKHATLAHLLLSRPSWSRDELGDASADLELMLDGALERINEASFDMFDQPLFEGDDPLEVDQTMIDRLRHEPTHTPA